MGDETIDRVLHDLRVISAIRENDKIYTEGGFLNLDHGGIRSAVYRWINGENRSKGVAALNNIISDAFAIAENGFRRIELRDNQGNHLKKLKSYHLITKVRASVADSLLGLKHLRATYLNDTSLIARIDVLKERVLQGLRELDASIVLAGDALEVETETIYPGSPDLSPRFTEILWSD
jgi:hypothetical protein